MPFRLEEIQGNYIEHKQKAAAGQNPYEEAIMFCGWELSFIYVDYERA